MQREQTFYTPLDQVHIILWNILWKFLLNIGKNKNFWLDRFGSSVRNGFSKSFTPGPGNYESKINPKQQVAPKYTFGLKKGGYLDKIKYITSPGPAVYNPRYQHTKTTFNYSMPGRPKSANTTLQPGPGNYELRLSLSHSSYMYTHR